MNAKLIATIVEDLRPHLEHILIARSGRLKVAVDGTPLVRLAFELLPPLYCESLGLDPGDSSDNAELTELEYRRWLAAAKRCRQPLIDLLFPYDLRCYFHWNSDPIILNEIVFTALNARQLLAAWPEWRAP
jgi:hypothetical protein